MRTIFALVVILILFVLGGCNKDNNVKFGIMMPSMDVEYYINAVKGFESKINELGGEVLVADAKNDENLQIKQASELIEKGVSVIVIDAVNVNTAARIVRMAQDKRVKIIAYDRMILNSRPDFYVSFNSVKIGEYMADYAIKRKPTGNYILLFGDSGDLNAHAVREGMLNILDSKIKSGDINIMYRAYIENWSGKNAYHKVKQILDFSFETPDVILSSYDGMSTASRRAFDDSNIHKPIIITGQNGEAEALTNILKGKQSMTIYKPAEQLGQITADIAWKFEKDKNSIPEDLLVSNNKFDIPALLLNPIVIDSLNIHAELIDKGLFDANN